MPDSIQFTDVELNRAISRNAGFQAAGINAVTLANSLGIYKLSYRATRKNRRRVSGYYITSPGNKPSEMPGGRYTILVKEMPSAVNARQNPTKRSLPEGPAPTTKTAPAQRKRNGIATRHSGKENVDNLT
jgi:hypothetical protein